VSAPFDVLAEARRCIRDRRRVPVIPLSNAQRAEAARAEADRAAKAAEDAKKRAAEDARFAQEMLEHIRMSPVHARPGRGRAA
jgi:hypothetical protein